MKKFKHSGTYGDLIYSLPLVKYLGGGEFYLHLDQINWIAKHYYGSQPPPVHQGRMTIQDFNALKPLMIAQNYISKFEILDPKSTEITHNLDRFREKFVGHPGNYVNIYADTWAIKDPEILKTLRTSPWLTVPNPRPIHNKPWVINRTARWQSQRGQQFWKNLKTQNMDEYSVFIGTAQEYEQFQKDTGWRLDYYPTDTLLDLAEVIAGCEKFIGNQSMPLSIAIGLGKSFTCELRSDLPRERNECYFPEQGEYF